MSHQGHLDARFVVGEEDEEEDDVPQEVPQPVKKETAQIVEGEEAEEEGEEKEEEEEEVAAPSSGEIPSSQQHAPVENPPTQDGAQLKGIPNLPGSQPLSLLEKKIVERNESLRKAMASRLVGLYYHTNQELTKVSINLGNTFNLTQEISQHLCDMNDDLISLSTQLPAAGIWVDSFLTDTALRSSLDLEVNQRVTS